MDLGAVEIIFAKKSGGKQGGRISPPSGCVPCPEKGGEDGFEEEADENPSILFILDLNPPSETAGVLGGVEDDSTPPPGGLLKANREELKSTEREAFGEEAEGREAATWVDEETGARGTA